MIVDVVMPKLGESITEGTIIGWRKKVGDSIERDEIILEIGTDKVDSEIPSPAAGVIVEILAQPNDVVPVTTPVARIETETEPAHVEAKKKPVLVAAERELTEGAPVSPPESFAETTIKPASPIRSAPETGPAPRRRKGRRFYTPLVRSIAGREGISEAELEAIPGSGKGGRVTKRDVLGYLRTRAVIPTIEIPAVEVPEIVSPGVTEEVVEMSRVRRLVAEHMRRSLDTAAHVHVMSECDVTAMVEYVNAKQEEFGKREGFKLTYMPFFVQATVKAIKGFPIINCSIEGTKIIRKKNVNIGMAVATDKGLMVPVIRNCEELNFLGICRKVNRMADRVRSGGISPEELQGSTFSITNYGIFGNLIGTPIINQPNVAILGIGVVKKRAVVRETEAGDAIVIRSMVYLSLGFDHRLIDGAGGGRFLQRIVHYLEKQDTTDLL